MSVKIGTPMAVDFGDRSREIQDTAAAMLELSDPMAGARSFRNPSILRCFDFSRWCPPPSWIVQFAKFYWLTVFVVPLRITVPNFIKIGRSVAEILQFFKFSK